MRPKIKFLAYYLPQFHPIPENDEWWGKGFTEWTNVKKAKPLFNWHQQPIIPGELGYYDLRDAEVQEKQATLAKDFGIDGFIYYQYWFGNGKMLLEKPAEAMLKNKKVDIPFCFCWANETWKGVWHGLHNPKVLVEQKYGGKDDYIAYFNYILPFIQDERYIKVNNKPMFHIYRINQIPDLNTFIDTFNLLARKNGFDGFNFVATGFENSEYFKNNSGIYGIVGTDGYNKLRYTYNFIFSENSIFRKLENSILKQIGYFDKVGNRKTPLVIDYKKGLERMKFSIPSDKYIPCIIPNWDNSARSGKQSMIFKNSSPKAFYNYLNKEIKEYLLHTENPPFVVLKSWNEWAEGNYLEPDKKYGRQWLQVIKTIKEKKIN